MNIGHEGAITGAGAPNYLQGARGVFVYTIGGTEYAFVVSKDDSALSIFDVSAPSTPTLAGAITGAGAPNYLDEPANVFVTTISGTEYAFVTSVADDALTIFDVSTPGSPSHVGVIAGAGAPNYLNEPFAVLVTTIGGTEYAIVTSIIDDALVIIDVSTPSSPSLSGVITGAGAPNYLQDPRFVDVHTISGTEYAFVASYGDGALTVIDVSTPGSPSHTGAFVDGRVSQARGVAVHTISGTEYAFVTSTDDDTLVIIDVSTPSSPSYVTLISIITVPDYLDTPTHVQIVELDGTEYAVITAQTNDALLSFDVSTPGSPSLSDVMTGNGAPNYLNEAQCVYIATIDSVQYSFVASQADNALTIFHNETVNRTCTVGTNGGLRDYTSLSAAESDRQRDLVAANETQTFECYNDGIMTNNVTFAGWTTDADHWIRVYTPTAERHTGTLGTGFRYNAGASLGIYIQVPNVTIEGLSIKTTSGGNMCIQTDIGATHKGFINLSHNLLEGSGIWLIANNATTGFNFYVWNNMMIGWNSYRIGPTALYVYVNTSNVLSYISSNSAFGYLTGGFRFQYNHANAIVKNCIAINCSIDFQNPTYVHGDSDYNGSSAAVGDADRAPGANSIHSMVAADSFVNVTGGSEDLHTKDASSDQFQAGTDLTLDANLPFTDDIDGETRGSPWDMGADNNLAAAAAAAAANSVTHIIMQMMGGR